MQTTTSVRFRHAGEPVTKGSHYEVETCIVSIFFYPGPEIGSGPGMKSPEMLGSENPPVAGGIGLKRKDK